MRSLKAALLLILALAGIARSEPTPVGPYNFGKGLNSSVIASDIGDDESPDLCNCINTLDGGFFKRKGSQRYIDQAISTNPIKSVQIVYGSTGPTTIKATLVTTGDKIYFSSSDVAPQWIALSTGLAPNADWSWIVMNNKAVGAGGYDNNLKIFDILSSSLTDLISTDGSTVPIAIKGKFPLMSKNYFILGNVKVATTTAYLPVGTTSYPSRIYYSLLNQPSSMTAQRFIEYRTDDGEEITGLGNLFDKTHIFKASSIGELQFTALNLPSAGGDFVLSEVVSGFGLYAPRSLAVIPGGYYIMASKDGIRKWDGGRRIRLNPADESDLISGKIRPLIRKLIRAGTYQRVVGKYYQKQQWYILSYEDPEKFPRGKNNSTIVYDLRIGEWFPFCNWLAESFATADGKNDFGQLSYGDSNDGCVHSADLETRTDDSRKEVSIHNMDKETDWTSSTQDTLTLKEGTASLKISINAVTTQSSMTYLGVVNIGEWYDKSKTSKSDKIQFKVFPTTLTGITSIRLDLEVNDVSAAFDNNFTSVTISSSLLSTGVWTTIEIPISSFPIRSDWADLTTENVPFANTLTYFGARFVLSGTTNASINVDDLRLIQSTDNTVKAYRFTKLFNLGAVTYKNFGQILLTRSKGRESFFNVDIYNDFGSKIRTQPVPAKIDKSIYVLGYNGSMGIAKLDSRDFSIQLSTLLPFDCMNGASDGSYLYVSDRLNDRLVKLSVSSFTTFTQAYGSFGSGTTNFSLIHQIAVNDKSAFLVDMNNQRIKEHNKLDLSYVRKFGSLGQGTTNLHQPTGIAADDNDIFVADEGNYRLFKLSKTSFTPTLSITLDYNTIGDTSLGLDEKYLYLAYNRVSDTSINFQDVVLEKRDKGNLSLISRVRVTPQASVALSTYTIMGDIALLGPYVYVSFTDDQNLGANSTSGFYYYIQKRLKSDFSLVKEYRTTTQNFSVIADGLSYKPSMESERVSLGATGQYIQLKYYDDDADNNWTLFNQTFIAEGQGVTQ